MILIYQIIWNFNYDLKLNIIQLVSIQSKVDL